MATPEQGLGGFPPTPPIAEHHMSDTQSLLPGLSDTYRLLSACYYEPEEAFLEEDVFGQMERALAAWSPDQAPIAAELERGFREAGPEALLLDYTRLFLGPFVIHAKPYGSVYLEADNVIMGDSTMAVLERYGEGGFKLSDTFREVPDHIAVELEFLYLLHTRLGGEDGADPALADLKHRFLSEHLGAWVTPFTKAMEAAAETGFYRRLAWLTRRAVLADLNADPAREAS